MNNKIELIYTVNYQQAKKDGRKIVRGKSWVNFENVINDPERGINDKSLLGMKCGGLVKDNGDVAFSTMKPEDMNDPNTQKIINAYHFLESTGNYIMPSLDGMIEELIYAKEDKINQSDAEKVDADADAMYIEFMKKIQEPETQMLLKSIGQYQMATDTYGWKLSCDNVMRILAQNPDATFLQTRRQWYDRFNRKIS